MKDFRFWAWYSIILMIFSLASLAFYKYLSVPLEKLMAIVAFAAIVGLIGEHFFPNLFSMFFFKMRLRKISRRERSCS